MPASSAMGNALLDPEYKVSPEPNKAPFIYYYKDMGINNLFDYFGKDVSLFSVAVFRSHFFFQLKSPQGEKLVHFSKFLNFVSLSSSVLIVVCLGGLN